MKTTRRHRFLPLSIAALLVLTARAGGDERQAPPAVIDATTLRHKTLCGYQGWFRCPGDGTGRGWRHWGRDPEKLSPETLTVEMWPDLSEFGEDETYPAPGFTLPDGTPARLFSSANPETVRRHFGWMREYGIDGVFLQRFLVELGDPSLDAVLRNVRASAAETGRAYAVCYDLTGIPEDRLVETVAADWGRLVDGEKVTADDRYLRHEGKPVVFVWGFYADRFSAATAHRVIDLFDGDGPHAAALVGGCQWYWRRERDPEWARAFRRLDVISPWNVGNVSVEGGVKQASTGYWKDDLAEARRAGAEYLPVIYPGFSWTNLKGEDAAVQSVPRLGGEFFRRQFETASDFGIDMAYVAMFDEVDEGTAVFKVTNDPPTQAGFRTIDGLPPDAYLRLTAEGAALIRGVGNVTPPRRP